MIKYFKIHSNFLIEGANVRVSWRTKGALFIKIHTGVLKKGWYKKNDDIQLNLTKDLEKISLYAFGLTKIEKKEIIIKLNKYKEFSAETKKIKLIDYQIKKKLIKTQSDFNIINIIDGVKQNNFLVKSKHIKPKINYSNLNIQHNE